MHFSKKDVGPYTYLCCPLIENQCIVYQYNMINKSDQTAFITLTITENEIEYDITSLVPLELYFRTNSRHCHKCIGCF